MTQTSFAQKYLRFALALALGVATFATISTVSSVAQAAPVDCSRGINLSFEDPVIASSWTIVAAPGWSTTDAGIELWQSGFNGVPAVSGNQLSELQGNNNAANWQQIPTLPGDIISWSFYHRGRQDPDTVRVNIGSPSTQTNQGEFTTGTGSWVQYGASYTVPAAQTTTRFVLQPLDTGSIGNLIDAVALGLTCDIGIVTTYTGVTDPDASGNVTAGDVFSFSYQVTNLGTATLASVGVVDTLGDAVTCDATILAPSAVTTCTMSHAVTQGEINAGVVNSDATASGTDAAGVVVTASDTESVPIIQEPAIALVKSGVLDDTVTAPSGRPDVGDVINYSFDVTNTGNVTLSSISVFDSIVAPVACPPDDLLPGQSVVCSGIYTIDQSDIDDGSVPNTATAYGVPPVGDPVEAEDSTSVALPQVTSIDISKTTVVVEFDTVGQVISYDITVANTGNVDLSDVDVSDPNADSGSISCDPVQGSSLAPGATATCTADHTVTQADLDAGVVLNTASVTAVGTVNDVPVSDSSNEVTVPGVQSPALEVTKTATSSALGDGRFTIAYTIAVANTGNVTVDDVTAQDNLVDALGSGGYAVDSLTSPHLSVNPSFDGTADIELLTGSDNLAPGENGLIRLVVTTVPQTSAGPIVNLATASAVRGQSVTQATGTNAENLDVAFDLTIQKSSGISVAPGGNATWTIVVRNDGPSATFGPLTVTDTLNDSLAFVRATGTGWACSHAQGLVTCQRDGTLASGDSTSIAIVTTVNAALGTTVVNNASVVAADAENESDQSNNSTSASITVDALPVTGIDTADVGAISIATLLFGLLLLLATRKRTHRSR